VAVLLLALAPACARSEARWAADLGSSDPFERALAAFALAEIDPRRGPELTAVLLETVDRSELRLGEPARRALRHVAPYATEDLATRLMTDPFPTRERRAALEQALVEAGEPAARTLVAAARGTVPARAEALVPVLLALGPAARAALEEAAGDRAQPELATWAQHILARLGTHGAGAR
jgi:hypothetical protein